MHSEVARVTRRAATLLTAATFGACTTGLAWNTALAAELPVPCVVGSCGAGAPSFVTQGTATATSVGNTLTVNQATSNAMLNWKSFNISRDGIVDFKQPDAASVALNRIFQADPSRIAGQLNANGRV